MRTFALVALAVLGVALLWWVVQEPRADREWDEEIAHTASVESSDEGTVVRNVRDWTYEPGTIVSKEWTNVAIVPDDIVQVWYIVEPFPPSKVFGHTFLSFEFKDGSTLALSIEARKERGEGYSELRGIFRAYELAYVWGTERDFVARGLLYLGHAPRMYPLGLSQDEAEGMLRLFLDETNQIAMHPRFYNTLTNNCTSALAHAVNEYAPGRLPLDLSWLLTARSDAYLRKEGLITLLEERSVLAPYREQLQAVSGATPLDFSKTLRTLVGQ